MYYIQTIEFIVASSLGSVRLKTLNTKNLIKGYTWPFRPRVLCLCLSNQFWRENIENKIKFYVGNEHIEFSFPKQDIIITIYIILPLY